MTDESIKGKCQVCVGSGVIKDPSGNIIPCPTCSGTGWLLVQKLDVTDMQAKVDLIETEVLANDSKLKDIITTLDEHTKKLDECLELLHKLVGG